MNNTRISTQPYKGSRDFYPEDLRLRDYIFGIWREVCKSYGYEEYDGPFLESFELYAAKSGEELVNEQLYSFTDRGERKIAIRPEMTPTLARMVAAKYKALNFPIRWFSIPNLWRYEKPQRGRLREFFQLNVDVMGIDEISADFEVMCLAIDIMKRAGAKEGMFELRINNRKLMDEFYNFLGLTIEQKIEFSKVLDKKAKISPEDFNKILEEKVLLSENQIKDVNNLLSQPNTLLEQMLSQKSNGAKEVKELLKKVKDANLENFIKFDPTIVRGLAYYTGIVFEQFDLNPQNTRAMFGGGRYNDLVKIFADASVPATGFGMGDVTFMDFLTAWKLLPQNQDELDYMITRWPETNPEKATIYENLASEIAIKLRAKGKKVLVWLDSFSKLDKQLKFAERKNASMAVIFGENEIKDKTVIIKNLRTSTQEILLLEDFLKN